MAVVAAGIRVPAASVLVRPSSVGGRGRRGALNGDASWPKHHHRLLLRRGALALRRAKSDDDDDKDAKETDNDKKKAEEGKSAPKVEGGVPAPEEGGPPPPPYGLSKSTLKLLNLLTVTGGLKGSLAVGLGALVGINAIGMIHPDLASTLHGLEWAAPITLVDAFIMVPGWDLSEKEEGAIDAKEKELTRTDKLRRAFGRYQREEALANPCRAMPAWQDVLVASVARLTDEMLERAVFIGFIGAWIADRAVEAGSQPYEVEDLSKYAAIGIIYLYLEVRLRRTSKRSRQTTRAFRVQRDTITGKQTMIPMDDKEVDKVMGGGGLGPDKDGKNGGVQVKTFKDGKEGIQVKTTSIADGAATEVKKPRTSKEMLFPTKPPREVKEVKGLGVGSGVGPVVGVGKPEEEVAEIIGEAVAQEMEKEEVNPFFMAAKEEEEKEEEVKDPLTITINGRLSGDIPPSPRGPYMFNATVKQFFDGFRSRLTLVTACLCYVTAPDHNLWAPIAGGLACDLLFITYQRNNMAKFLSANGVVLEPGAPPTDPQIKQAQMKLLRRDLDRRRSALAGQLMREVDQSVAAGAKEFNVLMREVVKEVQEAKGYAKEDQALTEVLDAIHKKFPPSKLDKMNESEAVGHMNDVLMEIRAEMVPGAEPRVVVPGAGVEVKAAEAEAVKGVEAEAKTAEAVEAEAKTAEAEAEKEGGLADAVVAAAGKDGDEFQIAVDAWKAAAGVEGAKAFTTVGVLMQGVAKEVQEAKGYAEADEAEADVMLAFQSKLSKLDKMKDSELTGRMTDVLMEIRAEMVPGAKPRVVVEVEAKAAEAETVKKGGAGDGVVATAAKGAESGEVVGGCGILNDIEASLAAAAAAAAKDKKEDDKEEVPLTLSDLASLAGSSAMPPAVSLAEAAAAEAKADTAAESKAAEAKAVAAKAWEAKMAEATAGDAGKASGKVKEEEKEEEVPASVSSTWDALDRLTAGVAAKLESDKVNKAAGDKEGKR